MDGGVRIAKNTIIFNLLKSDETTLDDIKKLYEKYPEKFGEINEKTGQYPIEYAEALGKKEFVEFMKSKGLDEEVKKIRNESKAKGPDESLEVTRHKIVNEIKEIIKKNDLEAIQTYVKNKKFKILSKYDIQDIEMNVINSVLIADYLIKEKIIKLKDLLNRGIYNYDFLKYIIDNKIDINQEHLLKQENESIFFKIINRPNSLNLIKLCIENGADVNKLNYVNGKTPLMQLLHIYVTTNDVTYLDTFIEVLKTPSININKKNILSRDVLLDALAYFIDTKDIIEKIVEKGANINTIYTEYNSVTPLIFLINNWILPNRRVPENVRIEFTKKYFNFFMDHNVNVKTADAKGNRAIHYASWYRVFTEFVGKIIEKGEDINVKSGKGNTPLIAAALKGNVETVKLLLEKGADKSLKNNENRTALEETIYYRDLTPDVDVEIIDTYTKIIELLGGEEEKKEDKIPWKGVTKTDVDKFDVFFEAPYDWSICPICLSFVERKEGCLFMSHDCKKDSPYYHKQLYDKYVFDYYGKATIEWCTVCGRSTKLHKHYILVDYDAKIPSLAEIDKKIQREIDEGRDFAFFDNKNCKGFGGGGLEEKVARFRRLREYALELNDDIDKKTHSEAMKELIEEVWNAPLQRSKKPAKIIEKKEWNIPLKNFPSPKRNETNKNKNEEEKNYPNIPMVGSKPTEKKAGECMCIIGGEDDIITYSFDHKDREGGVDHADMCICKEDLTTAIQQINANFGDTERPIGYCWFTTCQATLYPEEIKGIVPEDVYEEYRKKFNKRMGNKKGGGRRKHRTRKLKKYQKGGNKRSILHPVDVSKISCWSPPNKK